MTLDGSAVYCTLLLSDNYLPGAMVLAHSLRDNGSTAKLVALFTPDTLRAATINELQTVYDEIIPVHPMTNGSPANLWLMERPDLIATFTKIELWRQTQFQRIVYLDCDVVAIRAPDELLSLDVDFAAAPDVGWPDCFNSGVMVLRPNLQDYHALRALAERGISFDGADQGLLNMHFRDWHRLSFTYNCTPSANYQYIPAYKHFQNTISLVHFIGAQKPWNMPRQWAPNESPYNQSLGRWWSVYDKHYRPSTIKPVQISVQTPEQQTAQQTISTLIPLEPGWASRGIPKDTVVVPQIHVSQASPEGETAIVQREPQFEPQPAPHFESHSESHLEHHPEPHFEPQQAQHTDNIRITEAPHEHHDQITNNPSSPEAVHVDHVHPFVQTQVSPAEGKHTDERPQAPVLSDVPQHVHGEERQHTEEKQQAPVLSAVPQHVHGEERQHTEEKQQAPVLSAVPQYVYGEEHVTTYIQPSSHPPFSHETATEPTWGPQPDVQSVQGGSNEYEPQSHRQHEEALPTARAIEESQEPPAAPEPDVPIFEPPKVEWDAAREPPPLNTKPEGIALQSQTYTMSEDTQLFQPPASYPEAPKNMYYEVPVEKPEPKKVTKLFPWESNPPKPTRVFPDDEQSSVSTITVPYSPPSTTKDEPGPSVASWTSWGSEELVPTESWENYSRSNAWDEVPEIQRYMQSIQSISQPRKAKPQVISGTSEGSYAQGTFGHRITDFPSEVDRPSLPVTPAPIRRSTFWGQGDGSTDLPVAEGVPNQEDWNPLARLEELQRQQSAILENPELILRRKSSS